MIVAPLEPFRGVGALAIALVLLAACGGGGGSPPTVTVGGTVSGLVGSGLVLANNGGDQLAVSSSGTFVFASRVPAGGSYNVSILTQPTSPSQTCAVRDGAGQATNGNVTGVAVACTTNSYNVGGTVSGLGSATVIVLYSDLPHPDDQTIVAVDGPFTFIDSVPSGTRYDVTVSVVTSYPPAACTIRNANGTVADSNITSIAVTCEPQTYTLGGTVSGLTGSGLVLLSYDGQRLAISSNGSFSFPTPAPYSPSPYVRVAAQPVNPNEFCIGNPTDSTHWDVTCNPEIYTVSLMVNGLKGSGLELSQAVRYPGLSPAGPGAGSVTVNGNGNVTFPTLLSTNAKYTVRVSAQPTSPTQTCIVLDGDGVVAGANVSLGVTCSVARFAYGVAASPGAFSSVNAVAAFAVDGASGALSALPGSPYWSGDSTSALAVDPAGKYLYATNQGATTGLGGNTISAYRIDTDSGSLTAVNGSPYATVTAPLSIAVEPSGRFVYVANLHDNTISAFAVDPATGALTPVVGGPQVPGVDGPRHLTIHPNGKFIYLSVGNEASIWAYSLDGGSGALSPVAGSPFAVPNGWSPTGPLAIVPNGRNAFLSAASVYADVTNISMFFVDSDFGGLLPNNYYYTDVHVPGRDTSLVLDPGGNFAYSLGHGADASSVLQPYHMDFGITGLSLNANHDALGYIVAYSWPMVFPSVSPDPSGRFLYLIDAQGAAWAYTIDSANGNLTFSSSTPAGLSPTQRPVFITQ